jgi:hypothetical protein
MLQKCWPGLSGAARKAGQTRATAHSIPENQILNGWSHAANKVKTILLRFRFYRTFWPSDGFIPELTGF